MALPIRCLFAAALLLGGCGALVDDPSNLPRRGKWHHDFRLVALVVNDVWVDRKDAPFAIPADIDKTRACVEPSITKRDEIAEELLSKTDRLCHLDSLDRDGTAVLTKGVCGPEEKSGATLSGTAEMNGRDGEDSLEGRTSVQMNVRMPDGHSERVRAGFEAHWQRLGNCEG
jgi:hypothetical protein